MFAMALLFRSQRLVAVTTILALMAWAMGLPSWINLAQAEALANVSDVLSDSDLSVDSTHDITFTLSASSAGLTGPATTTVTFDPAAQGFNFTDVVSTDVATSSTNDVVANLAACTGGAGADAAAEFYVGSVDTTNDFIDYVLCPSDTIAAGYTMNFRPGFVGANDIANPGTAGSYVIRIDAGTVDTADTRIAIVEDVTVTAAVDTTLTFTITEVAAGGGAEVNGTVITDTSSSTTIPFGTVTDGQAYVLAQDLSVATNAKNGFTVTVEASGDLESGNGAVIDAFVDSSATSTPTAWVAPANTLDDPTTYGHWGLTTEDDTLSDGDSFGDQLYAGNFIQNAREVFYHTGPADGTTDHKGDTRVGYELQISPLQEAANDYTTTLTYVATPLF